MSSIKVYIRVRDDETGDVATNINNNILSVPQKQLLFDFDGIFKSQTQDDFYVSTVAPVLSEIFTGVNATILAYGATGSGKTYTMGTDSHVDAEAGLVTRLVGDIFTNLSSKRHEISLSMLEIYNEELKDLLSAKENMLFLREDAHNVSVENLSSRRVTSASDFLEFMHQGIARRIVSSTAMNLQSSRSHCILELKISIYKEDLKTTSLIRLVDLAGSERIRRTHAEGDRLREGININQGLFALGQVINKLSENQSHIPYRDSKLTRILKPSLGGNSITIMIACCSNSIDNLDETINTLRYASKARRIRNKPTKNISSTLNQDSLVIVNQLQQRIKQLECELSVAQAQSHTKHPLCESNEENQEPPAKRMAIISKKHEAEIRDEKIVSKLQAESQNQNFAESEGYPIKFSKASCESLQGQLKQDLQEDAEEVCHRSYLDYVSSSSS
ncbi:hypothetical protein Ciccas_011931 [Cichlidogyrus casuarinus]|uniref:Kinesin motor domain-containing protein n=1 Tax=Cichlidogyrus casuarinus TaxID=1844966 RepID=A0ABD2PS18_9PLAT